ncbi:hypothetical protein COV88_00260 [Candidatus Saccharibacteria bacterium CG11_big_fil_rev_8_21_14_0_20_41_19]|nr:hypothetical protein [Candidatus Saccharibacteria bacterium]OIP85437.1 MAG: hypothetical protein AUK57_03935 [Candidatus Saccharibacteria bacterium CG2_30_41_52]PIQ71215.1 MAG: hypothetical protein COV88_00260 [Candidatus Saccharibacteria bacterium CG11_big_fil_rev_8_21_14_0_20_41_19]PIZ59838.1 MAG: hypothetical protein COY18_02615 [Candidatus Saccharibacteria bacterium CG_4_10_14_0_2_um_filter_41_11]PJC29310.1 MAG: hypothetical protein CO052_04000 [Candidatus Saccharibacteria bacterium CG_4
MLNLSSDPTKRNSIILAVLLLIVVAVVSSRGINSIEQLQHGVQQIITHLGFWGPLLYTLAYIVIGLTGFSVTVLTLIALGVFEPITAFFVILVGASFSALFAFMLARSSHVGILTPATKPSRNKKLIPILVARIENNLSDKPFQTVFLLRMARLPYIALSYASGLVGELQIKPFFAATLISNSLSALAYVLVGVALIQYAAGASLLLLIGIGLYYAWSYRRQSG